MFAPRRWAKNALHWTAHPSRLDRDLKRRFDKRAYAMEELVAELGAAYLAIAIEPRKDHADYIADWLGALRMDAKAIFAAAAAAASRATDFRTRFRRLPRAANVRLDSFVFAEFLPKTGKATLGTLLSSTPDRCPTHWV
jgi:antirestriction protein ArdC